VVEGVAEAAQSVVEGVAEAASEGSVRAAVAVVAVVAGARVAVDGAGAVVVAVGVRLWATPGDGLGLVAATGAVVVGAASTATGRKVAAGMAATERQMQRARRAGRTRPRRSSQEPPRAH
jgi:hypothetical protein